MPKEVINPRHYGTPDSPSGHIQVGWSRERSDVQIATIQPGARIAFLDPDTGEHLLAGGIEPGFFMDLDRDGLNRLIRTLRKARDAAFGADA